MHIILVKKNNQLSKGIGQFRAWYGPILFNPAIRPDPVNTRTHESPAFQLFIFQVMENIQVGVYKVLTLKVPITTAAHDKFCDIFPNFRMKYRALFVIFEKAAKFEIVICCKL